MNDMFSNKKIQQLCLAAVLIFAACAPLAAQGQGQTLEGAWLISIAVDGQPGPFAIDMPIFDGRGGYRVIPSDKHESEAAGSYQRTGNRGFRTTHTHILYDDLGHFAGVAKVIGALDVNEAGDALAGRYRVDFLDAAGHIVDHVTGTITGKRVVPESL